MKKKIVIILACLIIISGLYVGVHSFLNHQLMDKYAKDYSKNHLGDYAKNVSGVILCAYDATIFHSYTNLSAHDTESNTDLIIWVSLFHDEKEYGVIITDEEKQETYQIMVDQSLKTNDKQESKLLEENADSINKLKTIANKEWGIF